jgi:tetratricopeptide (TPR) repeat protein
MSFAHADYDRVVAFVQAQLARGQIHEAMESLRQFLAYSPDHAGAHALLALVLVDLKRLHAAELEAGTALAADAELTLAHIAMARVLLARRQVARAREHVDTALSLDSTSIAALQTLAAIHGVRGRRDEALAALERARSIDPEDADVLADLGDLHLDAGRLDEAERLGRASLAIEESAQAIVLLGHVALRRGDAETARRQVAWALHDHPNHDSALRLLAAIKARESKVLGLWWRWSSWMQTLGEARGIGLLVGAYALYRAATIFMEGTANAGLIPIVEIVWLAVVVYTWVAPGLFQRMLVKEMSRVKLRQDF